MLRHGRARALRLGAFTVHDVSLAIADLRGSLLSSRPGAAHGVVGIGVRPRGSAMRSACAAGALVTDFPLGHRFGFRIAGLIAQAFFRPYAVTPQFTRMRLHLTPELP